jgi:hypothetical protein
VPSCAESPDRVADTYGDRVQTVAVRTGTFYGQAMTAGDISLPGERRWRDADRWLAMAFCDSLMLNSYRRRPCGTLVVVAQLVPAETAFPCSPGHELILHHGRTRD